MVKTNSYLGMCLLRGSPLGEVPPSPNVDLELVKNWYQDGLKCRFYFFFKNLQIKH